MATKPIEKTKKPAAKAAVKRAAVAAKPAVAAAKPAPATAPKLEAKPVAAVAAPAPRIEAEKLPPVAAPAPETAKPVAAIVSEVKPQPPIAAKAVAEGTTKMTDTVKQVEETVKKATAEATEKATAAFNDLNARARTAMEKAGAVSKDVVEFHKGNLEAVVEAGKIAAKGAQTVAQNAADYGRKNFEATTTLFKSAAAIKSPTDLFKLQSDFARSQFDGAVAELSKSTEYSLKLAGEIFQPIQSRYAVVAEEMKTRLAA